MGKSQLHELLAVEADLTNTVRSLMQEAENTFTKKSSHFDGQTRAIKYLSDARQGENATEHKEVVTTVNDKLDYVFRHMSRLYDALYQKEEANQRAKADLVVDGAVLIEGAPATFLLGMEGRLKQLRDMFIAIPTLYPAKKWVPSDADGDGIWKTDEAVTMRSEKDRKHKVLYEATKEHPAQITEWNEDVAVARIETVYRSGAWTPKRKADVLDRLDKLLRAVKKARQRANTVEVQSEHVADKLFEYLVND